MSLHYADDMTAVHHGDSLEVLRELPDCAVDAVVTDPPYGLEFMGKDWDRFKAPTGGAGFSEDGMGKGFKALPSFSGSPNPTCRNCRGTQRGNDRVGFERCRCEAPDFPNVGLKQSRAFGEWCGTWAAECLRVLKPGGFMVAFGGTRTFHRLACAIEDAGFEIRDSIGHGYAAWVYGSGFPKSLNVSKALAALPACACGGDGLPGEPGRVVQVSGARCEACGGRRGEIPQGLGTAMKPAWEPIVMARKPLAGTVAGNVQAYGTGALNIDACRVGDGGGSSIPSGMDRLNAANAVQGYRPGTYAKGAPPPPAPAGRWPSNVVLSHAPLLDEDGEPVGDACAGGCVPGCPVAELDAQSGDRPGMGGRRTSRRGASTGRSVGAASAYGIAAPQEALAGYDDGGGASRFFPTFRYQAKAPARERPRAADGTAHPTVKPLTLMRWLVRLVCPPGGTVLDPFAGSGTTAEACVLEGFQCVTVERDSAYLPLILARLDRQAQRPLAALDAA